MRPAAFIAWSLCLAALAAAPAQARTKIWTESSVAERTPYVDQSTVYSLRIYSEGNLQRVELTPPRASGAVVETLEGPLTSAQVLRDGRFILNEYRYAVTPIRPGRIEIEPAQVVVTPVPSQQQPPPQQQQRGGYPGYNPWYGNRRAPATAPAPVELEGERVSLDVRAPRRTDQPWLPLAGLDIQARWSSNHGVRRGEPLTLTLTLSARGAKGDRLPSLGHLLESPDFKAYPERPQTDWRLSADGRTLLGRRVETYTIVPRRDGEFSLPTATVSWWDVGRDRPAITALPAASTSAVDSGSRFTQPATAEGRTWLRSRIGDDHTLLYFVLPVGGGVLVAFVLGWWVGKGRPGERRAYGALRHSVAGLGRASGGLVGTAAQRGRALVPSGAQRRLDAIGQRLDLRNRVQRGAGVAMRAMPTRAKVWWCARCVSSEKEPAGVCAIVRKFACANLGMSANSSLRSIGDGIAGDRPSREASALRLMLRELDGAVYGGLRMDLRAWKRGFRRRLRRTLAARRSRPVDPERQGLPKLNP